MNRLINACGVVALATFAVKPAGAQAIEYGSQDDLRGVQYVYIDTGTEMSVRADIIDKLRKQLPGLKVATAIEESDAAILFVSSRQIVQFGTWTQSAGQGRGACFGGGGVVNCNSQATASEYSVPMRAEVRYGRGFVVMPGERAGAIRLVMEHSLESSVLDKSPWSKFTDRFVKAYRNANPEPLADRPPRRPAPAPSARASYTGEGGAVPGSVTFKGSYTASIAPGSQFEGVLRLVGLPSAIEGSLTTSTGRSASVTGGMLPDGRTMSLRFAFTDQCGGVARASAVLVGTSLSGTYEASDCNGPYQGGLLLTQQP